jgi:hypothetical protein
MKSERRAWVFGLRFPFRAWGIEIAEGEPHVETLPGVDIDGCAITSWAWRADVLQNLDIEHFG